MIHEIQGSAETLALYEQSRLAVAEQLQADPGLTDEAWQVLADELYARRREDLSHLLPQEQANKIADRSLEIISPEELVGRLHESRDENRPLNVKYGIDPTGADVHLGHAVPMILLNRIRRMGHQVTFIVGDFTASIGDPSGKVKSRPPLTAEDIKQNMATYQEQIRPLFDMDAIDLHHNGNWLNNYPLSSFQAILSKVNLAEPMQRRDFRDRMESGSGITLAELMYPVIMAIDSVQLQSDIEIGGKDQLLNMQMGRKVMEAVGMRPEIVITTDILEGTDGTGQKMSKSLGNYVGLTSPPDEMFGRIMSIPDSLLESYFKMTTEIEDSEWAALKTKVEDGNLNPKLIKELLAYDIVQVLHGRNSAVLARLNFNQQFSNRNYEDMDLPTISLLDEDPVASLATARGESRSAVMRLAKGGGLKFVLPDGKQVKVDNVNDLSERAHEVNAQYVKAGRVVVRLVD